MGRRKICRWWLAVFLTLHLEIRMFTVTVCDNDEKKINVITNCKQSNNKEI